MVRIKIESKRGSTDHVGQFGGTARETRLRQFDGAEKLALGQNILRLEL